MIKRTCIICGKPFETHSMCVKICSAPGCKSQRTRRQRPALFCKICGNEIPRGSFRYNYCSPECNHQAALKRSAEFAKAHAVKYMTVEECKAEIKKVQYLTVEECCAAVRYD